MAVTSTGFRVSRTSYSFETGGAGGALRRRWNPLEWQKFAGGGDAMPLESGSLHGARATHPAAASALRTAVTRAGLGMLLAESRL